MSWRNDNYRHALASRGILTTLKHDFESMDSQNLEFKPQSEYEDSLFYNMKLLGMYPVYKELYESWPAEVRQHFLPTTGLPKYDDMFANAEYHRDKKGLDFDIVLMSPEEYKRLVQKGFEMEYGEGNYWEESISEKKIQKLRHVVGSGERLPALTLNYHKVPSYFDPDKISQYFTQEGRHRAELMMRMGIEKVPVFIIWDIEDNIKELIR